MNIMKININKNNKFHNQDKFQHSLHNNMMNQFHKNTKVISQMQD